MKSAYRYLIAAVIGAILVLVLFPSHRPGAVSTAHANYVASSKRALFHRPDCKWAQKIAPENLQTFETREEAIAAGQVPCKVCKP